MMLVLEEKDSFYRFKYVTLGLWYNWVWNVFFQRKMVYFYLCECKAFLKALRSHTPWKTYLTMPLVTRKPYYCWSVEISDAFCNYFPPHRLWTHSCPLPWVEQYRIHHSHRVFLPGHPCYRVCHAHLRAVPGHTSGQVFQSRALLHYPRWHLPGLRVPFHSHCQTDHHILLPPAPPGGSLLCHVLLCFSDQNQSHCAHPRWQQEEDLHPEAQVHECLGPGDHCLHSD